MKKDNDVSESKAIVDNDYLGNIKDLVRHIKSLKKQIEELKKLLEDKEKQKQTFNANWQKKCNHPELFKITIPEERMPSVDKNSKYYELMKGVIQTQLSRGEIHPHPEMIYCQCTVCGLKFKEIESLNYVKELEIKRIKNANIDLEPISDLAKNLYHKKSEEFTLLEKEIEELNFKIKKLQEELSKLEDEANEIARILNTELGIYYKKHIHHYAFEDPIYTDRFYKD